MKKLLLITFVFFGLTLKSFSENSYNNYYDQPFSFTENNVSFAVYRNGEFDFYIDRIAGVNVNLSTPHVSLSFNSGYNYNPYVQYDRYGAVIQVENIPIYYDYYGRVSRIGSVKIKYFNGFVSRIGGLHIYYDGYGAFTHYSGYINRYNRHYVHIHQPYFLYPLYEYSLVSFRPYRKHYHPKRYVYYRNHMKNRFYNNRDYRYYAQNSRKGDLKYNRRVTQDVPKKREDYERVTKRTNQSKDLFKESPVRSDARYRRGVANKVEERNVRSNSNEKRNRERANQSEPVKRNPTDRFKKGQPERRSLGQQTKSRSIKESDSKSKNRTTQKNRNKRTEDTSKKYTDKRSVQKANNTRSEKKSSNQSKTRNSNSRNNRSSRS